MNKNTVRVRFAPAPTGMMHLGNVRAAAMNYLFAKQKDGVFVLRIEDTDAERNYDPEAKHIMQDLAWLGLHHTEGPVVGGPFGPYFQSQRTDMYNKHLQTLIEGNRVYRCFCSTELLDKKRLRQQALGMPPRYDRTCAALDPEVIDKQLTAQAPFIWRFRLDHSQTVTVNDLAHGVTTFELKNFSDFPLTRDDGSFTFIFANFVDDISMHMTHIFRGEDHLTNSACQAPLFGIFGKELPIYWHMPILCNIDGKKLSKRDFGFSLRDLQQAGFLPEAIVNYLAIIGGSFAQEIMSPEELVKSINFEQLHTTGHIKYDVEKLRWINRKMIHAYDVTQLTTLCKPFLHAAYPNSMHVADSTLIQLVGAMQQDITTLADVAPALKFYFAYTAPTLDELYVHVPQENIQNIAAVVTQLVPQLSNPTACVAALKNYATTTAIPLKQLYYFVRMALTGIPTGPGIAELVGMLGAQESQKRLQETRALLS